MRLDTLFPKLGTLLKGIGSSSGSTAPTKETPLGIKVSLSPASRLLANNGNQEDQDIKDSQLPDSIKQALLQIRTIKRLMAEAKAEMTRLEQQDPEKNADRIDALRHQLLALNGSLLGAMTSLSKLMRGLKLDQQQLMEATQLAMKEVKLKK